MGFYGNISNVNKTNMTFDKVYSNRKAMDESCALDGVYTGRYVLVEYEQYYPLDTFTKIYKLSGSTEGEFSTTYTQYKQLTIEENVVYRCVILTNWLNEVVNEDDLLLQYYSNIFYRGTLEDGELYLKNITSETSERNYTTNFNIDRDEYDTSRGYDSTVWMKQYDTNGIPKYINIAELNSVVPTFDVSVDAPTMIPNSPHFDEDSTNIYYNLHVQPQWGFRIKEQSYTKSDALTTHYYLDDNGNKKSKTVNADIYFNMAGFDPSAPKKVNGNNYISITAEGQSGQKYNTHIKGQSPTKQNDTQELSIQLPAIGDMMSDAWDIIHGPNRDDDMREYDENGNYVDSLQGRLNSIRLCEGETIPFKRSSDGRIVGAYLNNVNQDRINFLEAERQDALLELEERRAAGEFATEELYNAEKERINHEFDELIEAYRNASGETNEWIAATIDSENLNIAIKHKTKFEENQTNRMVSQSPSFGSSFNIPVITVDKAGHITSLNGNSSVQLPQGSLTVSEKTENGSQVITDLSFVAETGAITAQNKNVGELLLTNYEESKNATNELIGYIQAANTINEAFKGLDEKAQEHTANIATINNNIADINNETTGILALAKADATTKADTALINAKSYADGIKTAILGEGIKNTFDTLVEIQNWIEGDGVNATELAEEMAKIPSWAKESTKPTYTAEEVGALSADTVIPTVPTLISAFENDVGYLTEHQSLDEYAKTADVPNIVLNMSDFIALQNKVNELKERIAQLENPTTTE